VILISDLGAFAPWRFFLSLDASTKADGATNGRAKAERHIAGARGGG